MRRTILYHANCPDGFGAALAYWLKWGDADCTYLPVQYGQPPPAIPASHGVLLFDFSYDLDTTLTLAETHASLTVLDHHATAEAALAGLPQRAGLEVVFDQHECGATLVWKYLHRHTGAADLEQTMPLFYKYLRDRDLWKWQLHKSREVSLALWSLPRTFPVWRKAMTELERLKMEGSAIARYVDGLVAAQGARWHYGMLAGQPCVVVNATCLLSELGEWLCESLLPSVDAAFVALYFDRNDDQRQWSLRSTGDVDVSVIAQAYGGGGHKHAAGFVAPSGGNAPCTP